MAARRDLTIGSAGTHPFALWEDQRISARPRYRDLIEALRFVARQEIIFGLHVHVGIDDADKAIHVANGMRVHVAAAARAVGQLAVLARRRDGAGLDPHADLPPVPARRHAARLRGLGRLRAPHRLHGRLEGDRGLHLPLVRRPPAPELRHGRDPRDGRADPGRAHARARGADPGDGARSSPSTSRRASSSPTTRTRCSTRTAGSPPATASTASSSTSRARAGADEGARAAALRPARASTRRTSARPPSSRASSTCSSAATAPSRQKVVYEANHDLHEVVREIVGGHAARVGRRLRGAPWGARRIAYVASGPDLFVVCKNCGSEVCPYITECPYCGTRLRKRAPKLEKGGGPPRAARRRERPKLRRLRPGEIPGVRADGRPYATIALVLVSVLVDAGATRPGCVRRRSRTSRWAARSTASGGGSSPPSSCTTRPATRSSRWARSSCSAGCSSAVTAPGRRCSCSSWAAPPARPLVVALDEGGARVGRQRVGARAARRLDGARRAGAPARRGGRRRPARRARVRRRAACSLPLARHGGPLARRASAAASPASCSGFLLARLPQR